MSNTVGHTAPPLYNISMRYIIKGDLLNENSVSEAGENNKK